MRPETQCIHAGKFHDSLAGGVNTPIFTSSAFEYLDGPARRYPRYYNTPNQEVVTQKLAALEGAEQGLVFSSGMAAVSSVLLAFLQSGDHAVVQDELYGGSHAFVEEHFRRIGVTYTFCGNAVEAFAAALTDRTRLVFMETPTNPLLSLVDIRRVADAARRRGALSVIDNTFATPIHQNPLALGVDVVIHSGTKYLGGHSDLCCGAALARAELIQRVRRMAVNLGGSLNALDCHLLERSLLTLAIRVERQTENAGRIARFLAGHPAVARVNYPGLGTHPGHEVARAQMRGFGAMLSFELKGATPDARAFMKRLKLIVPALSLGGVETTICDPASTSHAKVAPDARRRLGIADGLLRLSVGIEHADDLVADLKQALEAGAGAV